jgi:uncharacterized protein (TIGR00725 family)
MATYVAVIGAGTDATDRDCADAREVGRLLAERGVTVITGGLGGVMAAAAAGARAGGGVSVGLLPGPDRSAASEHLTVTLPTGLGELRNGLVVRAADGIVAVGGSWGTLSEVALARRTDTPIVSLRGWHITDEDGGEVDLTRAESAAAAVDLIQSLISRAPGRS